MAQRSWGAGTSYMPAARPSSCAASVSLPHVHQHAWMSSPRLECTLDEARPPSMSTSRAPERGSAQSTAAIHPLASCTSTRLTSPPCTDCVLLSLAGTFAWHRTLSRRFLLHDRRADLPVCQDPGLAVGALHFRQQQKEQPPASAASANQRLPPHGQPGQRPRTSQPGGPPRDHPCDVVDPPGRSKDRGRGVQPGGGPAGLPR